MRKEVDLQANNCKALTRQRMNIYEGGGYWVHMKKEWSRNRRSLFKMVHIFGIRRDTSDVNANIAMKSKKVPTFDSEVPVTLSFVLKEDLTPKEVGRKLAVDMEEFSKKTDNVKGHNPYQFINHHTDDPKSLSHSLKNEFVEIIMKNIYSESTCVELLDNINFMDNFFDRDRSVLESMSDVQWNYVGKGMCIHIIYNICSHTDLLYLMCSPIYFFTNYIIIKFKYIFTCLK